MSGQIIEMAEAVASAHTGQPKNQLVALLTSLTASCTPILPEPTTSQEMSSHQSLIIQLISIANVPSTLGKILFS